MQDTFAASQCPIFNDIFGIINQNTAGCCPFLFLPATRHGIDLVEDASLFTPALLVGFNPFVMIYATGAGQDLDIDLASDAFDQLNEFGAAWPGVQLSKMATGTEVIPGRTFLALTFAFFSSVIFFPTSRAFWNLYPVVKIVYHFST